ncbi:MAG: ABC transporter substrate-binding protein, partial [Candidatus Scalindua sp.]
MKIGVILPLTGPSAVIGEWNKNGIEIALEMTGLNNKIDIIYEDSKNDPKTGISAFNKLTSINNSNLVISSLSGISVPLIPLSKTNKTPLFLLMVSYPDITKQSEYCFRYHVTSRQ